MADTYTTPQTIQTIPAIEIGVTQFNNNVNISINFGVPILENVNTINSNYCITTGTGAFSVGPIKINSVVTVPNNSSWVIK
jgi:hypothetical protein